jgi:hypothetical protein
MNNSEKDARQMPEYCIALNAMHRAARSDPFLRKKRLARDDNNI